MNTNIIFQSEQKQENPSTLLMPETMLDLLGQKIVKYGSIAGFLHHAVRFINPVVYEYHPSPGTGKISYQGKTAKLVKINFRPYAEDWEILRIHAFSMRISMILLFILLLLSNECHEGEGERAPTKLSKFFLSQSIRIRSAFTYIELQRLIL